MLLFVQIERLVNDNYNVAQMSLVQRFSSMSNMLAYVIESQWIGLPNMQINLERLLLQTTGKKRFLTTVKLQSYQESSLCFPIKN